ncbi:serine hydrolase domain-containing protein [Sphingorhabdus sp.]|uniref:serine hydrolase domain-containing protein n=1 Tax=Sphingorhabdus sp. TaxID=1902408 RepID=UPI0035B32D15
MPSKRIVKNWAWFAVAAVMLLIVGWVASFAIEEGDLASDYIPNIAEVSAKIGNLPDTPEEWEGRIDYPALEQQLAELSLRPEMAGLAVAVVEDGRISFVRTYGFADRSTGALVGQQTVFRWASVSKTATGILAAKLVDEGRINLDRPASTWRSSLRLPGDAETRISVGQIMSQQTGLTKNAYDERLEDGQNPRALRGSLAEAPLQCEPGTCHTYQNIAFDAASEILARAAKQPFDEAVHDRFFRPLGMVSARYGMAGLTNSSDWARPHNGQHVRQLKEAYWRVPAAAGIESNIVDFARWMQAMMGEYPDVLPASVLKIAHAPRVKTGRLYGGDLRQANGDASYGLGWRSFSYNGLRLEGHSGAVDGYRATMIFEPATRTGVVAMWNSNWGFPFRIPFAVIDSYHDRADSNWLDLSRLP